MDIKTKIVSYITSQIDRDLFVTMDESIRTGYRKAHVLAVENLKHTPPGRLRGQNRRYLIDDVIAGIKNQGLSSVQSTYPKGEHYVVICSGNITISHIELHENQLARPAKHRAMLALKNKILEPETGDFFKEAPPHFDDQLHLVAMVLNPDVRQPQDVPADIVIAVPYTNWKGYHLEIPLQELILRYNIDDDLQEADSAWPTLKDALIRAENDDLESDS